MIRTLLWFIGGLLLGGIIHIATILAGPMVAPGRYDARLNHYGVLRTIVAMYGLVPMAGAARARPITDVWSLPVVTSPGATAGTVGRPFVHRLVAKKAGRGWAAWCRLVRHIGN